MSMLKEAPGSGRCTDSESILDGPSKVRSLIVFCTGVENSEYLEEQELCGDYETLSP